MGIKSNVKMGSVALGNPLPLAAGRVANNAGNVGVKDIALASSGNPFHMANIGKKLMFGKGKSKAAKAMSAAEKAAKKQRMRDHFGPNMLKAQKDGRNTVSAKRALQGERINSSAHKPVSTSGGNTSTDRGVLGNRMKRNEGIAESLKQDKKFKDEKIFESIQKEEAHAKLVNRQDDSAVHRVQALRNEKSALIQGNQAGYDSPRLAPVPRQSGVAARPPAPNMRQTRRNQTFNNIPNRTEASKALASRMNNYR